jgi:hypothetical protein
VAARGIDRRYDPAARQTLVPELEERKVYADLHAASVPLDAAGVEEC